MTIQGFQNQDDWTCAYCHNKTDGFYKKLHYRCLPEDTKRELQIIEESKFELCPTCNKPVDPYYKNFHVCEANSISTNLNPPNREKHEKNHYKITGHIKTRRTEAPIPIESKERKEKGINMFLLNGEIIKELIRAFNNIYPLLGLEFDKVLENMPNERESFKRMTESLFQKIEQQKSCKHSFKHPFKGLYGYYEKYCSRCGKRERVKPNGKSKGN